MKLEKVTNSGQQEAKRRYVDACGLAHALELVGERWSMLIVRELLLGPRRFSDLRADIPGLSANVLTQRLSELEDRGLVKRRKLPPPASVQVYEATPWALDASPILCALGRWAFRSPAHDPSQPVSGVAILLSMTSNFDAKKAGDLVTTIGFRFRTGDYYAQVCDGALEVHPGTPSAVQAVVTCDPNDLKPILYGGAPIDSLAIEGDKQAVERYVRLFSLPPKVEPSS
jgi:DNA-binding HxlR family transcriptional regulator